MDVSVNAPIKKARVYSEWVWFEGSTALLEGQAVCYNWDYNRSGGSAASAYPERYNRVELPSTTNAQHFAGVASRAYSAVSTGQFIEIYRPGSVCNILVEDSATTTIGVGIRTFDVTEDYEGYFRYEGLPGAGSAMPLQTLDGTQSHNHCLALLTDGPQSGGVEVVTAVDNDSIGTLMIGGTTLVTGAALSNGNCTYTLADGSVAGLLKKFKIITTEITTNDFVITISSGATDDVDDVSLDTCTFAGGSTTLNTQVVFEWHGAWIVRGRSEDVPALAGS